MAKASRCLVGDKAAIEAFVDQFDVSGQRQA